MAGEILVSADWLREHLEDSQVAIADCRFALADPELGRRQYDEGHIPGAYFFDLERDLSSPVQLHGGRHPLPDPVELAPKLAAMGLDSRHPNKLVVAYDASRFAFAARFWWLLRYLGYDRVAVLDGGWPGWQARGYPVSQVEPALQPATFIPRAQAHWVVDRQAVSQRKAETGTVVMDAREAERYRGEREPIDPVAGHIPGAINLPWQQMTDEAGQGRSPEALRQLFANLQTASEIMVYCGSGVTACVNLLALERAGITTGTVGKLYAGSWSDWCSYADAAIEVGEEPSTPP
jgi:thiosulfate/3-mercaptopyruvate sulfurtransferase